MTCSPKFRNEKMTECSRRAYQEADLSAMEFEPSAKETASQVRIEVGISEKALHLRSETCPVQE